MGYQEFLESKKIVVTPSGLDVPLTSINAKLFGFQRDIVRWALAKGKAAIFAGTGLGKTGMQLEWANQVHLYTFGDVLILAPLAVSQQTVKEVAQQRTKALGLLHKQVVKDSCMSRQGTPDYLVTMRKPGINPEPVDGEFEEFIGEGLDVNREAYERHATKVRADGREPWPFKMWRSVFVWQKYASPVWMDIRQTHTLQYRSAREEKDERHICPLQLDVIARAVELWSNPGDVVFDPFGGIMSTGYQAIKMGRRFVGVELKESYYKVGVNNLEMAISETVERTGTDD